MQVEIGEILEGKVTGITKFGAFVELEEGKTGMVHISEAPSLYPVTKPARSACPSKRLSQNLKDLRVSPVRAAKAASTVNAVTARALIVANAKAALTKMAASHLTANLAMKASHTIHPM